ncbi:MAG: hypothetical protein AAFX85_00270 [Pseudomonadota bacterium]
MYDLKWLRWVARDGLSDLGPAVRQVFDQRDQQQKRLQLAYGDAPRRNLLLLALCGVVLGELLGELAPMVTAFEMVNPAAVILGAAHAALIRRFLFRTEHARADDFPWIAASIIPAAVALMLNSLPGALGQVPSLWTSAMPFDALNDVIRALMDVLAVPAGFGVAVATLCYRRRWLPALRDLAVRMFVFRFTVWFMILIFVDIGIVGQILSEIIGTVTGWYPPGWLGDLADAVSYTLLMGVILLALIGATWTVCRENFPTLLEQGEVDVLASLTHMSQSPKAREARKVREEKKQTRRDEKQAKRKASKRRKGDDGTRHA